METATTTSHEARARNAKAHALAEVLFAGGAVPADLATEKFALGSLAWGQAAHAATAGHAMGTKPNGDPVNVNAPNSQATIDAVARILGDLIAHENDQAAIAEQVAPQRATLAEARQATRGFNRALAADNKAAIAERKATDSGEYRRTVGQLDPETKLAHRTPRVKPMITDDHAPDAATDAAFAPFAQADRR